MTLPTDNPEVIVAAADVYRQIEKLNDALRAFQEFPNHAVEIKVSAFPGDFGGPNRPYVSAVLSYAEPPSKSKSRWESMTDTAKAFLTLYPSHSTCFARRKMALTDMLAALGYKRVSDIHDNRDIESMEKFFKDWADYDRNELL